MRSVIKVLIFSGLLSAVAQAQATVNTYQYFMRIPATNQSCQAEADNLKNQFTAATRTQVTSSICNATLDIQADGSSYKLYSLLLTYQSSSEVIPYAASFGTVGIGPVPDKLGGIYSSYASCLADIGTQTQNFQTATQLKAIAAFCAPEEGDDAVVYRLEIDGLGDRAESLYVFDSDFVAMEDGQTQNEVENAIFLLGGTVAKDLGSKVYYYAKHAVGLDHYLLGFFNNQAECTSQLTDANTIFTHSGGINIIARCLPTNFSNAKVSTTSYALEVVSDGSGVSQDYGMYNKYYSFSECMNDKARVLAAQGNWGYGAICSPAIDLTGQYVLNVFTHY